MRLSFLRIDLFVASALLVFLTVVPKTSGQASVYAVLQPVNKRRAAPELALKDSYGKPVTLKEYRGKIVLLDFWPLGVTAAKKKFPGSQNLSASTVRGGSA